ncbi:MAG: hypothetical protein ACQEQA_02280 [Bacillota bacterium]
MKKIVFLLCMIGLVGLPSSPLEATDGAKVTQETIDGEKVTVIEGEGKVPFKLIRGDRENHYEITQSYESDGQFIMFGYAELKDTTAFYDGYVLVVNDSGEIEHETIIERNYLTEVKAVEMTEDAVYVLVDQHIRKEDDVVFKSSLVMKLSDETKGMHETEYQLRRIDVDSGAIFMSEAFSGPYEHALMEDGTVVENGETYGLEDGAQYSEEVLFYTLCENAMSDGAPIEKVHRETYPGHYLFTCEDKEMVYTLNPLIEGVTLFEERKAPLTVAISGGRTWLNDELYVSESLIDMPGYHTLRIEGANGYELRRSFTLTSGLEGVLDGETYHEKIPLFFSGNGLLNGTEIQSGHVIDESGEYDLVIDGYEGYSETYSFEVNLGEETPGFDEVKLEIGIVAGAFLFTGGGFLIYKKRK